MSTLNEQLSELQTARNDIKTALENKGQTVTKDIRTYAEVINNITAGSSTNGVKLFETTDEMNSSTGNKEGDLAVVYRSEIQNATVDSKFSSAVFPATVVLPEAITDYVDVMYRATDDSVMFDCWGQLDVSMFSMSCYTETGSVEISYTSEDGITYTRTDGGEETVDFGTEIYYYYTDNWNDAIGYFIQTGGNTFNGLFSYGKDSKYISFIPVSSVSIDINNNTCAVTGPALDKVYDIEILKNIIKNNHSDYNGYVYNFYIRNNELYCCRSSEAMLNNMYYIINRYFYDGTTFTPCIRLASSSATLNEYKIDYDSQTITEYTTYTSATVHTSTTVTYAGFTMDTLAILYWPDSFGPEHDTNTTYFYPNSWSDIMSENVTNYSYGLIWLVAPTQFDATTDSVLNRTFYGKNGAETGTLQETTGLTSKQLIDRITIWSNIDNGVAMGSTDLNDTFNGRSDITKLPPIDTANVTSMQNTFYACRNLEELPISSMENVTNARAAFRYCEKLTSLPLFDTSKVTNMEYMIGDCPQFETIPTFDTSSVTFMAGMFYNCTGLHTIPSLNTSNVTSASYFCCGCTGLVNVPSLDFSKLTSVAYMFTNCTQLSDESLNNILAMFTNATNVTSNKTLKWAGLTEEQVTKCATLSNYQAFLDAGWTTGY